MSTPENELPELWTQIQLCEYLNKSEAWAERGRLEGYGPKFIRVGRSIRYDVCDVLAWMDKNRRSNTSEDHEAAAEHPNTANTKRAQRIPRGIQP